MIRGNVRQEIVPKQRKQFTYQIGKIEVSNYKHTFVRHRYEDVECVEARVYDYDMKNISDREKDWREERRRENGRREWLKRSRRDFKPLPVWECKKK